MRWTKLPVANMSSPALRSAAAHLILSPLVSLDALYCLLTGCYTWQLEPGMASKIWASRHDRGWRDSKLIPALCFNDGGEWAVAKERVQLQPSLHDAARQVRHKVEQVSIGSHARAVRAIVVADYIEELSAWAVGLSNVAHYLERCF